MKAYMAKEIPFKDHNVILFYCETFFLFAI